MLYAKRGDRRTRTWYVPSNLVRTRYVPRVLRTPQPRHFSQCVFLCCFYARCTVLYCLYQYKWHSFCSNGKSKLKRQYDQSSKSTKVQSNNNENGSNVCHYKEHYDYSIYSILHRMNFSRSVEVIIQLFIISFFLNSIEH